jgi:hypothetical protein
MRAWIALICSVGMVILAATAPVTAAAEPASEESGPTPPRLGFVNGRVSFYRPGEPDWTEALVNTPLAAGDRLETDASGSLELQVGMRSYVRAWGDSAIELIRLEPDLIRFRVLQGRVSFDLDDLEPGRIVEAAVPNLDASFRHPGVYRVDADGEQTRITVRNGGPAEVSADGGSTFSVPAERTVIAAAGPNPILSSHPAPPPDSWDEWNSARSDFLLASESARYVPDDMYGAGDLDRHGRWQVEADYGPVWIPNAVAPAWAPYSSGVWVNDPYYGWTWVDTAPWGWAPYHYGRWVHVGGRWGWSPGHRGVRPVYAPALVAFLEPPPARIGIGVPVVSWVALGWGEPCVPWWGRPGFIHRPWWGGWGGPRVVNNVVVHRTTVVKTSEIHTYRHTRVHRAVVAVHKGRFGQSGSAPPRYQRVHGTNLRPNPAAPEPRRTSAVVGQAGKRAPRPSETHVERPTSHNRPPQSSVQTNRGSWNSNENGAGRRQPVMSRPPEIPSGRVETPRQPPRGYEINRPLNRPSQQQATAPARRNAVKGLQPTVTAAPKRSPGAPAPKRVEPPGRPDRKLQPAPAPAPRLHRERSEGMQTLRWPPHIAAGQLGPKAPERRGAPAALQRPPTPSGKSIPAKAPNSRPSSPKRLGS